jgi:uncharacterized protein (DUF924 family)
MHTADIDAILSFWFGDSDDPFTAPADRLTLWFTKRPETDAAIRDLFEPSLQAAAAGRLDGWRQSPSGWLALIVLLDQFPRNIYRDTPRAFAFDELAQRLALNALHAGVDKLLRPIERVFAYLPLEHAEDLDLQRRCVACFEALRAEAPPQHASLYDSYLDYARRHLVVIERFGRFPHRNAALSRDSTPEEAAFLQTPGSSF